MQIESKVQTIVLGDLNFDLLETPRPSPTKHYLSLFQSLGFDQLITKPTRPISNSLLDHIFVSHKDFVLQSGTLPIFLSDHLPVFVCWKSRCSFSKQSGHKILHIRFRKTLSIDTFLNDLSCAPWNTLEMFRDPNDALAQWYSLFNNILDSHAPFKACPVKRPQAPDWFNADVCAAIMERNRLYRLASLHNVSAKGTHIVALEIVLST